MIYYVWGRANSYLALSAGKRIEFHAMLVLLALNGIELSYTQKELYEVILDVAAGKQEYEDLLDWGRGHQN